MTNIVQKLTIKANVLEIRTLDCRMVGTDESTELLWPPLLAKTLVGNPVQENTHLLQWGEIY